MTLKVMWKVMATTLVRMPMLQTMGLFRDLIYQQHSDLLKLPFTVSNPGIRLPTSGQYDNELSFLQLFFTDDIIGEIVQETNRYAREKIERLNHLANVLYGGFGKIRICKK